MNLIDRIDDFLVQRESRERVSYYPSEVSRCLRQLYYKWNKSEVTNPIPPGGYWKMALGNKAHDLVHEFLEKAGLEIIPEVSFKKDIDLKYPLSGRIDNIFIDEDGSMAGIEVKSSYGRGIRNIKNDNYPKKNDLEQVLIYMGANPDLKRFYIIYIATDDGYRCQFEINHGKDGTIYCEQTAVHTTYDDLINRFKVLEDFLDSKVLPPREYLVAIRNGEIRKEFQKDNVKYKSDWCCSYCAFMDGCWAEVVKDLKDGDNAESLEAVGNFTPMKK